MYPGIPCDCGADDIHFHTQSPKTLLICASCGRTEEYRPLPVDNEDEVTPETSA